VFYFKIKISNYRKTINEVLFNNIKIRHSVRCWGPGLAIDLSLMRGTVVDPVKKTALVFGGTKLGEMDNECERFGLCVTAGKFEELHFILIFFEEIHLCNFFLFFYILALIIIILLSLFF